MEIVEGLLEAVSGSILLVIAFLIFLVLGFIVFLVSKIPPLRWLGILLMNIIKYALLFIFNILAIGLVVGMTAIWIALLLALFQYMDWPFFMVGEEILILHHDAFFMTAVLVSLTFVVGIFLGTFIFSFMPPSTRKYVIASYLFGVGTLLLALPTIMQFYAPEVDVTFVGMLAIAATLPVVAIVFAIATGQKRYETRRDMTYKERRQIDREEKEKEHFRKHAIFPWIKTRST